MWLPIVVGENEVPDDNDGSRRRTLPRGRKGKEAQLKVEKGTTIKHIRLELYEMFKVSPLSQRLLFKGRELSSDETIGGIGVLLGDHINLVEVVEVDDFEIGGGHGDEGFGGTALVGQKCESESASRARRVQLQRWLGQADISVPALYTVERSQRIHMRCVWPPHLRPEHVTTQSRNVGDRATMCITTKSLCICIAL